MSKTFTFAGVSRQNGVLAFRVANDVKRIDHLRKVGHTDVEMSFLNTAMTKQEAAQRLIDKNFANGRTEILAILVEVTSSQPKAKTTVKVRAKKAKVVAKEKKLSIEEANARVLATVREVTAEEAMRRLVFGAVKARRTRKTKEAV